MRDEEAALFVTYVQTKYNNAKDLNKLWGMIPSGEVVEVDTGEGKSLIKPATQ